MPTSKYDKESNNPCVNAGDFNLILNPYTNRYDYLHVNTPKARNALLNMIVDDNLIDCWRDLDLEKNNLFIGFSVAPTPKNAR